MWDAEDKSGDGKKSGGLRERGKELCVPAHRSLQQQQQQRQQLTWNLEPRWDDCKVGGGVGGEDGQERENEVLERVCEA